MSEATPPPAHDASPGVPPTPRHLVVVRWTRRALLLVAAVIAAALMLVLTIDLGRFPRIKAEAEKRATEYLQRPLHIGRLSATLWPGVFALDDVVIDGKHAGDRPFFKAGRIYAYVPWTTLFSRRLVVELVLTDWQMVVENFADGASTPRLTGPKSTEPRRPLPFTTTMSFVHALGGQFVYEDHTTPWQVTAPNLSFSLVRAENLQQYVGTAKFSDGAVKILSYRPMRTEMSTRFTLDGTRVDLRHIDLVTEGSVSHINGTVDFSKWPEQIYHVNSTVDFPLMREIYFPNETWKLGGTGEFTGTFYLYKDGTRTGRILAGDFRSEEAAVNDLHFPELHGSLIWTPERFAVTHADADLLDGQVRFVYDMAPLGQPGGSISTFHTDYTNLNLSGLSGRIGLKSLQLGGRADGTLELQWPTGRLRTGLHGFAHVGARPPAGVELASATLPAVARPVVPEPSPFQSDRVFEPMAIGADLDFTIGPDALVFEDSWAATPFTYVSFGGRLATKSGGSSAFPFKATSHDWQESDRVLTRIMTAVAGPTGAIEVGGRGTFDGVMTGNFQSPRISGRFAGESTRVWDVNWGRAAADVVIENRHVDISSSRFGDGPDGFITATGRFALGYQRDNSEEINAHVVVTKWPMKDLRHAFQLDDWPMDGTIAEAALDLRGKYREMFGTGRMRIDDGVAWGEPFTSATGDLDLEGTGIRIHRIDMKKGGSGIVRGDAQISWSGTYAFQADGEGIPVEQLSNFTFEQAPLSGRLRFTASGAGSFDNPTYTFRGTIEDLFMGDQGIGRVTGQLRVDGRTMAIERVTANSGLLDIDGRGTIVFNDRSDADLHLRFTQSSIDPYLKFFAPQVSPYTRAIMSGSIDLVGPLSTPASLSIDALIDDATLTLFDYELRNDGPARLTFRNNTFQIGQLKLRGADTNLELAGGADSGRRVWNLSAAGSASLSILQGFFPNMQSSGGATLNASLSGPFDTPSLTGEATITNGRLRPLTSPHSLDAINGRIKFDDTGVNLEDADCAPRCLTARVGTTGNSNVDFGGRIALTGYRLTEYNLTARGRSITLRFPERFSSTVNMDLFLTGPIAAPRLSGNVDVLAVVYRGTGSSESFLGLAGSGGTTATLGPTLSTRQLSEEGVPLALDIQVTSSRTALVDNDDARIFGIADLRILGTFDRPSFTGRIDIDGGEVRFLGNRYYVREGAISFLNPENYSEPDIEITADTRLRVTGSTVDVNVRVSGPYGQNKVAFTSDPVLPETDILALLFGGRVDLTTLEERNLRSPQESQQLMVQSMAGVVLGSPISNRVATVVKGFLPLDTVQITPLLTGSDPFRQLNPTARITLGQQISPKAFLTYSRTLGTNEDEIILLEYDQNDRLSWVLSRNEDRTFSIDFRIRYVR